MFESSYFLSAPLSELMARAAALRDEGHGNRVSYSRKVFIPLTRLCRDVCHYCTFARSPREGESAYLSADEVLAIARAGAAAGCQEALFTLGDKPELRYREAKDGSRGWVTRPRSITWRRCAGSCSRKPACFHTRTRVF